VTWSPTRLVRSDLPNNRRGTTLYDDDVRSLRQSSKALSKRALTAWRDVRSPDSGLRGQSIRFALVGGTVALIYVGTTTVLATVVGIPFQAALLIGLGVGLVVHFTLQRVFVWTHHDEFALPLHHQLGRYLAATAVQYGVTAASTAFLPSVLGVSAEVVYLGTVAVVISTNFLVFRNGIFHSRPATTAPAPEVPPLQVR
jgi:putative flippase GtrA